MEKYNKFETPRKVMASTAVAGYPAHLAQANWVRHASAKLVAWEAFESANSELVCIGSPCYENNLALPFLFQPGLQFHTIMDSCKEGSI